MLYEDNGRPDPDGLKEFGQSCLPQQKMINENQC